MGNTRRRTQRPNRTGIRSTPGTGSAATTLQSDEIRSARSMNWQSELKYINGDLRQLLIISTVIFVLLFAVGFFL